MKLDNSTVLLLPPPWPHINTLVNSCTKSKAGDEDEDGGTYGRDVWNYVCAESSSP